MSRAHRSPSREETRRSDWGSYEYTERDDRGLRLIAEMKFMPYDVLGQWLDPDLAPATLEPGDETESKKQRGGKRDDLPWPRDRNKRLHATAELARRWDKKMDKARCWKPWEHQPTWVRVTAAGLRTLGLDWPEIEFPEDPHWLTLTSHTYLVNKRRLYLARGGSNTPKHEWISERQIYVEQVRKLGTDAERAHRPDGVMRLEADGSYPLMLGEIVIEHIPLQRGQTVAIEEERSSKGSERLGKGILPSLLSRYDFAWYFCHDREVYDKVIAARRDYLRTDDERKRIRILLVEKEKG
jgi:hypothetical protein